MKNKALYVLLAVGLMACGKSKEKKQQDFESLVIRRKQAVSEKFVEVVKILETRDTNGLQTAMTGLESGIKTGKDSLEAYKTAGGWSDSLRNVSLDLFEWYGDLYNRHLKEYARILSKPDDDIRRAEIDSLESWNVNIDAQIGHIGLEFQSALDSHRAHIK